MNHPTERAIREAVELLRIARSRVPHLLVLPLSAGDVRALRESGGYRVQRRAALPDLYYILPSKREGRCVLRVRANLPPPVERFVEARFLARRISPAALNLRTETHLIFALALLDDAEHLSALLPEFFENLSARRMRAALCGAREVRAANRAWELYLAGRDARRRADYSGAVALFEKAVSVSSDCEDDEARAASLVGLGRIAKNRGEFASAVRLLRTAAREAKLANASEAFAGACHNLGVIASECFRPTRAQRLFRLAYRSYPRASPHRADLIHDLAFLWIQQGDFSKALIALRAVYPSLTIPAIRVLALCNMVRAAGGAGVEAEFEVSLRSAQEGVATLSNYSCDKARCLLAIAQGAWSMERWELAERTAARAYQIATANGEARVGRYAGWVLAAVGGRAHPARPSPPESDRLRDRVLRDLGVAVA